ncbi:MAG: helix-turn-helix domain-containing protein [Clostridia bacterium]|nr:helix-turn-helix domain-containing protein [Clostridia bacterium]
MNILKHLRQQRNLLQKDVAAALGVDRTTYLRYENGATEPDFVTAGKLADFFDVTVDYILGREPKSSTKSIVLIPVYARVTAGVPVEALTEIIDYEEIPERMARNGQHIAFRVSGHSMEPKISDGDVVIVRVQPDIEDGDIAVVTVNGDDGIVKKIKKTPKGVSLISFNPAYDPLFYNNDEVNDLPVRIVGRVVELRAKF